MTFVWIRRWHVARAYGHIKGVPEVDTLCGRRIYGQEWRRGINILQALLDNHLCLTCSRRATRFGWLS
jgi:hypothetical protein